MLLAFVWTTVAGFDWIFTMDLVVNGVEIIGLAATDTVLADDTPFGF